MHLVTGVPVLRRRLASLPAPPPLAFPADLSAGGSDLLDLLACGPAFVADGDWRHAARPGKALSARFLAELVGGRLAEAASIHPPASRGDSAPRIAVRLTPAGWTLRARRARNRANRQAPA